MPNFLDIQDFQRPADVGFSKAEPLQGFNLPVSKTELTIQDMANAPSIEEPKTMTQEEFFGIVDGAIASWDFEWQSQEEIYNWMLKSVSQDWFKIAWIEYTPEVEEDPWFFGRIWEKLWERWEQIWEAVTREKTIIERGLDIVAPQLWTALDIAWPLAWWLWDIIWETVLTWFKALWTWISAITPDFIEEPIKEAVWSAWTAFLQSDIWQAWLNALQWWVESYWEFKEENPIAAWKLEAVGNILSFAPIGKAWSVGTKWLWEVTTKTWIELEKAATKQTLKKALKETDDFVRDLVAPPVSKKQLTEDILKGKITEWWVIAWRQRVPTKFEASIANEVRKVPWVSAKKTTLENNNAILTQISKLDNELLK